MELKVSKGQCDLLNQSTSAKLWGKFSKPVVNLISETQSEMVVSLFFGDFGEVTDISKMATLRKFPFC